MSGLFARLRTLLDGLAPRERLLLSLAGSMLALTLAWLALVQPILSSRERAQQRVAGAEQQLEMMQRLRGEFDDVNARLSTVERRIQGGPQGNFFTLLESLARRASVAVEAMEPQAALASEIYRETKVQVVLKSVTLAQAVNYLHQIETAPQLLSVKSLRMRTRRDDATLMDVTFTVSSFEPVS
jgi:type II secretory pathway component PulM